MLGGKEFSASRITGKSLIADRDLAAHRDEMGPAFDFEAFKGIVVEIHLLGPGGNPAALSRVIEDQVGVASGLDGSFARKQSKNPRRVRACAGDKLMKIDPATVDSISAKEIDPVLE